MTESSKRRILLVDDNTHLLVTVSDFLAYEGFEVTRAESAEEALEQLETGKPDLIVLDISMPGMGGMGFLKRISESDGTLRYPVLVLTARGALEEFFGSVPVQGFLAKPCSEQELVDKIKSILEQQAARAPQPRAESLRILLAEDDTAMADRICKVFRGEWPLCEIKLVSKGPEVLENAVLFSPDISLIKQVMHGMNGADVVSLLGQIPKISRIPVILYSEDREAENGRTSLSRSSGRDLRIVVQADPFSLLQAVMSVRRGDTQAV